MIFDTDIFIWVQRGNKKAARLMKGCPSRFLSIQTYLELLQGAQNRLHHKYTKDFIKDFNFQVLPLTEKIGHRALVYIEEYSLSTGIRAADAIIAATAIENNLPLTSGNKKHFGMIKDLELKIFRP